MGSKVQWSRWDSISSFALLRLMTEVEVIFTLSSNLRFIGAIKKSAKILEGINCGLLGFFLKFLKTSWLDDLSNFLCQCISKSRCSRVSFTFASTSSWTTSVGVSLRLFLSLMVSVRRALVWGSSSLWVSFRRVCCLIFLQVPKFFVSGDLRFIFGSSQGFQKVGLRYVFFLKVGNLGFKEGDLSSIFVDLRYVCIHACGDLLELHTKG